MKYRKQHYLPYVYLKEFSENPTAARRRSYIWRLGEPSNTRTKTERQCVESHFYSKLHAKHAEDLFHHYEEIYAHIKGLLRDQVAPKTLGEYFGLMFSIISLHLRNPSYQNRTHAETIEAYLNLEPQFLHRLLRFEEGATMTHDSMVEKLKERWRVSVVRTESDVTLVTSDNPAHVYVLRRNEPPVMMTLPITPTTCAVAFDEKSLHVRHIISASDAGYLNASQAFYCQKAVYSHEETQGDIRAFLVKYMSKRQQASGFIARNGWAPNTLKLGTQFEFVRLR